MRAFQAGEHSEQSLETEKEGVCVCVCPLEERRGE